MAIEIVDFPIKNGGSFHSYVKLGKRVDWERFLPGRSQPFQHDSDVGNLSMAYFMIHVYRDLWKYLNISFWTPQTQQVWAYVSNWRLPWKQV
jgi:hypothetical protein